MMNEVDPGNLSSIGAQLRAAREAKGLSLDEVASQTRIPIRHLKHIEEGNWDALPATTYSVGFARAYANSVGLNGNEIGAQLREELGATRASHDTPTTMYEPADPSRAPPKSLAIVALLILVLLVGGYFIWRNKNVGPEVEPVIEQEVVADDQAPQQPQPSQAAAPTGTGPVVLTATDEVWLRVYEGSGGATLFQGVLRAGDRYEVPSDAKAPQIRTGRPQALQVTVGSTQVPPLGQAEQTINNVSLLGPDLVARAGASGAQQQPLLPQPSQPVPGPAAPAQPANR